MSQTCRLDDCVGASNVRSPESLLLTIWSLAMTSPTVDGAFGLSRSTGDNIGSRKPRRIFLAPEIEISLIVMGIDIWSAICRSSRISRRSRHLPATLALYCTNHLCHSSLLGFMFGGSEVW